MVCANDRNFSQTIFSNALVLCRLRCITGVNKFFSADNSPRTCCLFREGSPLSHRRINNNGIVIVHRILGLNTIYVNRLTRDFGGYITRLIVIWHGPGEKRLTESKRNTEKTGSDVEEIRRAQVTFTRSGQKTFMGRVTFCCD